MHQITLDDCMSRNELRRGDSMAEAYEPLRSLHVASLCPYGDDSDDSDDPVRTLGAV